MTAVKKGARRVPGPDGVAPGELVVEQFDGRPFRSWVPGVDQQNLPTSGDHHFAQGHVWLGSTGVSIARRPPGITTGAISGDDVMVSFPMGSARPDRVNGTPLRQSYFWVAGRGAEVDLVQPQPWLTANIVFAANAEVLDPIRDDPALAVFEVGDAALRSVRDLVTWTVWRGAATPKTLSRPRVSKLIHENVVLALSELVDRAHKLNIDRRSFPAAHRLVRQMDEYITDVGAAAASSENLARHLNRSLRTIQASLVAVKGMGFGKYLLITRLWNARRVLETAPPGTLVKTVAIEEGFWHLGRFTQRYSEFFGESPSQTLQKSRGG